MKATRTFTIDLEMLQFLQKTENASAVINELLHTKYDLPDTKEEILKRLEIIRIEKEAEAKKEQVLNG